VAATPADHSDHAAYINNLSHRFSSRYDRTGNLDDLEAAISHAQDAVANTPADHHDRAGRLSNLSNRLSSRYDRTGNLDDLEAAISHAQHAAANTPPDHPDRAGRLSNLSHRFSSRYDRTGNLDDVEAAISHAQDAVAATPVDHPDRAAYINNLSKHLSSRYDRTGNLDDLETAIGHAQDAVAAAPADHPDRAGRLNNLSNCLSSRYDRTGNLDDLEAAISHAQDAVAATPADHPDQAGLLNNLSAFLSSRYDRTGNLDDLEAAIGHARDAVNLSNAIPSHRVTAARRAIRLLAAQSHWHDAAHVADTAIYLLPLVCSRYLSRDDQQHAIAQTAGLAADAGSIFLRLTQPAKALQLLEFGRGMILGYLIDSRSDPESLYADHPSLAQEYDRLRFILSRPVDSVDTRSREDLIRSKQNAPRELERCLATIRAQPGYERFLLEPAIEELVVQAQEGPLVTVNVTDFGSHAVIVLDHEVLSLELPPLLDITHFNMGHLISRFRTVGQRGSHGPRDLQSEMEALHPLFQIAASYYDTRSLSWLWEHLVAPILDSIASRMRGHVSRPRIWWIGTGVANALPFHAAGMHDGSTKNTLDRAISSYTPTIKALAYARSCLNRIQFSDSPTSVVIVAMPTTPQGHPLPGVEDEITAIQQAAGTLYRIQIQQHPGSEDVLQAIQETDIVHFACHGSCNAVDPSESHLLLQNNRLSPPVVDRLSVKRISDLVLHRARIAFLSACSTAQVTAHQLTDEAIHLASAFQVAGFGHVIASLWSVDDAACAAIARAFYSHLAQEPARLFSNRLVAEALHDAVLEVRKTEQPGVWASFVHYGA
jgi:tetratricopeptide (TPR) repeat protein